MKSSMVRDMYWILFSISFNFLESSSDDRISLSFFSLKMKINNEDKFLQMFDLSFDVSIALRGREI